MQTIPKKLESILLQVQKPGRYVGGELHSVQKVKEDVALRFAFCFPDVYEVGMSHLGMKILYSLLNEQPPIWCERVFTPWADMEALMREHNIPLYGLESFDALDTFDIIGFTLQYELCYTNLLTMLDLAGIPLRSSARDALSPLVIAGGPCCANPEPLADFVDLFVLGDGEQTTLALCELYLSAKSQGLSKDAFLRQASELDGIYVPSLYEVSYLEDGRVEKITPLELADGKTAKFPIKKAIVKDLTHAHFPQKFIVPFLETVHDRAVVEPMRGCIRGCRFCQAGYIYRPAREKDPSVVASQGKQLCESTGYDELSLCSLSTSDYTGLEVALDELLTYTEKKNIGLSLPSLRMDNFPDSLVEKIIRVRKSGLTFAPEAGSQRMRDVINKNITEDEIFRACDSAFAGGYTSVKLYFMLGLPLETLEDCKAIMALAQKIVDHYYQSPHRQKGKAVQITVSTSVFVPKPFTPFAWVGQDDLELIEQKQRAMKQAITTRKINFKYHTPKTAFLEAAFARGDRRLGAVLARAFENGCRFDGWDELFSFTKWEDAFTACDLSMDFYATRHRPQTEVFPWSHLDFGVSEQYLKREWEKAQLGVATEIHPATRARLKTATRENQPSTPEPKSADPTKPE